MKKLILLGKSDAAISMISNIISSNGICCFIEIINNLNLEIKYPFEINGIEYHITTELKPYNDDDHFFLGVSYPSSKENIFNFFKIPVSNFTTLIHKTSSLSPNTKIGYGCLINSLVSIDAYTEVGDFVTLNRNSSIGHHTIINDFVTINPGSNIAGHVNIGRNTTIGMGSNIINNITIGENVVIGAGSVVTKNIPNNVVAYGNPCKIIRENETQSL